MTAAHMNASMDQNRNVFDFITTIFLTPPKRCVSVSHHAKQQRCQRGFPSCPPCFLRVRRNENRRYVLKLKSRVSPRKTNCHFKKPVLIARTTAAKTRFASSQTTRTALMCAGVKRSLGTLVRHAKRLRRFASLSSRGTSGERAGERGNSIKSTSSPRPFSFLRRRGREKGQGEGMQDRILGYSRLTVCATNTTEAPRATLVFVTRGTPSNIAMS